MYANDINQAYKDTSQSISKSQQVANEMMEMIGAVKMAVFEQNHTLKVRFHACSEKVNREIELFIFLLHSFLLFRNRVIYIYFSSFILII
jgi:hypothetical protein